MFTKVQNEGRYKTAQAFYWHVKSDDTDYLFTDSQLKEAKNRAEKNPEDIPAYGPDPGFDSISFMLGGLIGVICGALVAFIVLTLL